MGLVDNVFGYLLGLDRLDQPKMLEISELDPWFKKQSEKLISANKLNEELNKYIKQAREQSEILKAKIELWKSKSVNQDIEGLPLIYAESKKILESVDFHEKQDINTIMEMNSHFTIRLEKLMHKIEESLFESDFSFILEEKEKFTIKANPLVTELLKLNGLKESFEQRVHQSGFAKLKVLREKIDRLEYYQEKINILHKELEGKSSRLRTAEEKKKEKELQLLELKEQIEYSSLQDNKDRRKQLLSKLEQNDDSVVYFFSKMKPALKEYQTIVSWNQLLADYIEDPLTAFNSDKNLEVLGLLQGLKDSLVAEEIKINPELQNAVMSLIDKANAGYLQQLRKEQAPLKEELSHLRLMFQNREFSLKVEDAQYRLQHFSKQVEKLKQEMLEQDEELKETTAAREQEAELFKNLVRVSFNQNMDLKV